MKESNQLVKESDCLVKVKESDFLVKVKKFDQFMKEYDKFLLVKN